MSCENWRWNIGKHPRPTAATIAVIERTGADAEAARKAEEKRIEEGGQRVPFGFSRVLDS